jgi:hypothetical protein
MDRAKANAFDTKSLMELGVLFPPKEYIYRREPALVDVLAQYKKGNQQQMTDYIDVNWKLNITLFDLDFETVKVDWPPADRFH